MTTANFALVLQQQWAARARCAADGLVVAPRQTHCSDAALEGLGKASGKPGKAQAPTSQQSILRKTLSPVHRPCA